MIALIQRVTQAQVAIDGDIVGSIYQGIMALICVEKDDTLARVERLVERILTYRIFHDNQKRMNLSLRDIDGGLLLVLTCPLFSYHSEQEVLAVVNKSLFSFPMN